MVWEMEQHEHYYSEAEAAGKSGTLEPTPSAGTSAGRGPSQTGSDTNGSGAADGTKRRPGAHTGTGQDASTGSDRLSPLNLLYLRFALALISSIFLIFISLTLHFEAEQAPVFLRYISLGLATVVMFLLAGPFLDNLKREVRDRRLSLASLIFTGSGAAYILSAWNTLAGSGIAGIAGISGYDTLSGNTYFETSAMILTFYVGSLLIDTRIKKSLSGYARIWEPGSLPEVLKVSVESTGEAAGANGVQPSERVPVQRLGPGDLTLTEAGQPVLFDAVVEQGGGFMDESHLTGEPDAIRKERGDRVSAGSISIDGEVLLRVIKPFRESTLSSYMNRARAMRSRPGYYERVASRGASILLSAVIVTAFAGLAWHLYHHTAAQALEVFLAVLLIGCPCAFAISTPSALWVAHQRLHRTGIVAMGGSSALERLSDIKLVMFDKTGTLTEGVALRELNRVTDDPAWPVERLMRLAGAMELEQTHPFARAIRRYLAQHELVPLPVCNTGLIPGQGVRAEWQAADNGAKVHSLLLVNNRHAAGQESLADGDFGLFLDGRLMMRLRVYQPPRAHLEESIMQLHERNGMEVAVVTGDPAPAETALPPEVTAKVHYHGGCSPEEKAELVDRYRESHGGILFVGDGTNDLMAINKADLGVGVYTGSLSIRNNADFVLFHPSLLSISEMLTFSGRIRRTIRGNFFWAIIYNIIGIGVALTGLLHPFFAILAMMLSSFFVTMHALSLRKSQPSLGRLEQDVNRHVESDLLRAGVAGT
ncbi:HAD-IC family P-type ATPase [Balneolales bacterium ANBcel1]|nr:HAD-IC family P-type ATPase [Balneolales bacterium ANBcel1]